VAKARLLQAQRYQSDTPHHRRSLNVDADVNDLETYAAPDPAGQDLLHDAAKKLSLSARAYHRVLKVARTIADLEASENVRRIHIAEALSYRRRPAESVDMSMGDRLNY
jgi:magnesium chelatase family protein